MRNPNRAAVGLDARRRRAGDRGLTTLEWLLIVAAVAGIAALAVVLVQNVVSDTSEQIAGSSARAVAARLAGEQVVSDSLRPRSEQPTSARTWDGWQRFYDSRCKRLEIIYGDAGVKVVSGFQIGSALTGDLSDAFRDKVKATGSPSTNEAVAECTVTG